MQTLEHLKEECKVCPACGKEGDVTLSTENRTHIVKQQLVTGEFYFYECEACKFRFTSTASDELSLANFKHKKK